MLNITVPAWEDWDPVNEKFSSSDDVHLLLEHSLLSLSKWESKNHKYFIGNEQVTQEELLEYIKCMTVSPKVRDEVYKHLTNENLRQIDEYIKDPMTATTFTSRSQNKPRSRKIITSELLYHRMIRYGIPFECQKWHLNRLLTLIHVCEIEEAPKKKMSAKDKAMQYRSLNAARRAKHNTRG